jgi:hypothetical protein
MREERTENLLEKDGKMTGGFDSRLQQGRLTTEEYQRSTPIAIVGERVF